MSKRKYPALETALEKWRALQPLSSSDKDRLSQRFTIDFNFNSNHIEGNTLTYGQTELLLLFGRVSGEADLKDFMDMKASAEGLKMIKAEALDKHAPLTQNFIRQLHKTLLREDYQVHSKLPSGDYFTYTIYAGQYKTRPNSVITRTGEYFEYASPEETSSLMTDLVDWYNEQEKKGELTPIELAALFHYRYIRIHPFEDGNGRIARLLVNFILLRHGYPMIVVRTRNKQEYLNALSTADAIVGKTPSDGAKATLEGIGMFLKYFVKLATEEINNNIKFITEKGYDIWCYDGQIVKFRSEKAPQILYAIMRNPDITIHSLSEQTGLTTRMIDKHIKQFIDKQYIQRREDNSFYVFIRPSIL